MDYPALKKELLSDPDELGYRALIENEDYAAIADVLNQVERTRVPWQRMTQSEFTAAFAAILGQVPELCRYRTNPTATAFR